VGNLEPEETLQFFKDMLAVGGPKTEVGNEPTTSQMWHRVSGSATANMCIVYPSMKAKRRCQNAWKSARDGRLRS